MIRAYRGVVPKIAASAYIDPSGTTIKNCCAVSSFDHDPGYLSVLVAVTVFAIGMSSQTIRVSRACHRKGSAFDNDRLVLDRRSGRILAQCERANGKDCNSEKANRGEFEVGHGDLRSEQVS